jgi:hypothetical protein
MSSQGPEVRVRLVTDDQATISVEQLREALKGSHEEAEGVRKQGEGLTASLLKANLYTKLISGGADLIAEGIKESWEMGEKLADAAAEAADEMNQQVRESTGLMSLMDRGQHSMGEVYEYAKDVREELSAAGTAAGVSTASMQQMFDQVIERGSRSTEEAKELTEQMAEVGKVIPAGMEGLAQGFNMMELGIVRARNPLVQLIASTGVLKGNAHEVAKALMAMSPAEQMEKATDAIKRQADILKKGDASSIAMPTLPELRASFGNLREGFLEAVGEPLLHHVIPPLAQLRDYLLAHKEEIADFGTAVSRTLTQTVDMISALSQGIYSGVVKNWHHASEEFHKIFGDWMSAWDYASEHTDEIKRDFEDIGSKIVDAFSTVARYVKAAAEVAMDLNDMEHFQRPGTSRAVIGGTAAAQGANLFGPEAQKNLDDSIAKYRQLAAEAHFSSDQADKYVEGLRASFERRQEWASKVASNVDAQNVDQVSLAINSAKKAQDVASESYAFDMIARSDSMTKALMTGAIQVDGGFDALYKVIEEQSPELRKKIDSFRNTLAGVGIKGQAPSVNFYGSHFSIKQDFRDQDPDRIMQVFKRDLAREATSRRQSRTAGAFGL